MHLMLNALGISSWAAMILINYYYYMNHEKPGNPHNSLLYQISISKIALTV